jgi:type II secretory pathway predicted ATPase ExeA/septal ring-binding cell division protein DamX
MYYAHFGLNQAPFKITPNTDFFFNGGNRGPILEALVYAVSHGEGIVKVTGEVGSGKTMLCNMLQTRLPAHIETVYLANPSVSPDEIVHAIAFELQLGVDRGASRLEVTHALQQHLLKRHAEGKRVVVFVEESQSMPIATLEEIRLLSNLETSNDKLLQIVLFGQPELDDNLRQPHIRQLRERITHSFRLEPLRPEEVREYLMFRMRAAGYRGPDLFSPAVVKRIAQASGGLTRRINLIADKALLAAFSENTHTVRAKHVEAAIRDSEFSRAPAAGARPRYARAAALVVLGIALGVTAYALLQPRGEPPAAAAPAAPSAPVPAPVAVLEPAQEPLRAETKNAMETSVNQPVPAAAATPAAAPAAPAAAPPPAAAATADKPLPAAPPVAAAAADPVQARIAATQEWLASASPATYSIQLLGADNEQQLKHHLNVLSKSVEMNKVFVYRTIAKQKPSLTVLYGSFDSRQAAQDALATLPSSVRANRPILRTVQGIRAEIQQHQRS